MSALAVFPPQSFRGNLISATCSTTTGSRLQWCASLLDVPAGRVTSHILPSCLRMDEDLPPPSSGQFLEISFRRLLSKCEQAAAGNSSLGDAWPTSPLFHHVRVLVSH